MRENVRLAVLVVVFAVAAGGLLWLLLAEDEPVPDAEPVPTAEAVTPQPEPVVAPIPSPTPDSEPAASTELEPEPDAPEALEAAVESADAKDEPERAKTGAGSITVKVTDRQGEAVAGADLMLERIDWEPHESPPDDHVRHTATTGPDGEHKFRNLPEGPYAARALTAYASQTGTAYLSEDGEEDEIQLELWEGRPMSGVVVTKEGEPIPDAVVHVHETDQFEGQILTNTRARSARQYTDEQGRFAFPILWMGRWRLYAKADGYTSAVTGWYNSGADDIRIELGRGGVVSGQVVEDGTRDAVPEVEVYLASDNERDRFAATSDEDGNYAIANVRADDYKIAIEHEELVLADAPQEVTVEDDNEKSGYDVYVAEGGIIRGKVVDAETGKAYPSAELRAYARDSDDTAPDRRDIITASDGTYEIKGLGNATYEVYLREVEGYTSNDRWEQRKRVSVQMGEEYAGIDFRLNRGLAISGLVVGPEGDGIEGARTTGRTMRGNTYSDTHTEAGGAFTLTGFKPGQEIHLNARSSGLALGEVEPIVMEDRDVRGVVVPMIGEATIAGTVVDSGGAPLVEAGIYARPGNDWMRSSHAESEAGGEFILDGLSPGTYNIYATRETHGSYGGKPLEVVEVEQGGAVTGIKLVLEPGGNLKISGQARNRDGDPISGVRIDGWSQGQRLEGRTSANGKYSIDGVKEGTYQLRANHSEYSSMQFHAEAGDRRADFVMERRGGIEGRVLDAISGTPLEQFEIMARKGGMNMMENNPHLLRELRTVHDPDGVFELDSVEAGQNIVVARAEGFAMTTLPVEVAPEESTNIELRLLPGARIEGVVVDTKGNPVLGARLFEESLPREWARDQAAQALTDSDGQFVMDSVSPETTVIFADHPEYAAGSAPVSLRANGSASVEIQLPFGATVEGVVRVGGTPRSGVAVNVHGVTNRSDHQAETTGEDGRYEIAGMQAGDVRVTAWLESRPGARHMERMAELQDGFSTVVDFDFAPGDATIEGRLTYEGGPVDRGHVEILAGDPQSGMETFRAQVEGNGYYRIDGVPAGPLSVRAAAMKGGQRYGERNEIVARDGDVTRADIEFGGGQTVQGALLGVRTEERVDVELYSSDLGVEGAVAADDVFWRAAQTCCLIDEMVIASGAAYAFHGVTPGDYVITARILPNDEELRAGVRPSERVVERITVSEGQDLTFDVPVR